MATTDELITDDLIVLLQCNCELGTRSETLSTVITNNVIDWTKITRFLGLDGDNEFLFTYPNCKGLMPRYHLICKTIADWVQLQGRNCGPDILYSWTGCHKERLYAICTSHSSTDSPPTVLGQLLELTCLLEYCIGNIYFTLTKGRKPPHLLRDLLQSEELKGLIGAHLITFMRILLGHPVGINLRNIIWHGFAKPGQIPTYFREVLLAIFMSIGVIVDSKKIEINARDTRSVSLKTVNLVQEVHDYIHGDYSLLKDLLKCTQFVSETHYHLWLHIIENQDSVDSLYLILPQVELILRRFYGQCNSLDIRAKMDDYYITLDTILQTVVPSFGKDDNQVHNKLHLSVRLLLYDLFVAERGPRLRDKLGHGEVMFSECERKLILTTLFMLTTHTLNSLSDQPSNSLNYRSLFYCLERFIFDFHQFEIAFESFTECNDSSLQLSSPIEPINVFIRHCAFELRLSKQLGRTIEYLRLGMMNLENQTSNLTRLPPDSRTGRQSSQLGELLKLKRPLCDWIAYLRQVIHKILDTVLPKTINNSSLGSEFYCRKLFRHLQRIQTATENISKYTKSNEWINVKSVLTASEPLFVKISFAFDAEGQIFKREPLTATKLLGCC